VLSENCDEVLGAALIRGGEHGRVLVGVGHTDSVLIHRGGADGLGNYLYLGSLRQHCEIVARRNESVTVPFAQVRLSQISSACTDSPKPLIPWPTLSSALTVDGAAVPRGWEYAVVYWAENGMHRVQIPQSSRSIRNLAFLGPDDEIVISVPIAGITLAWKSPQDEPTATLQAHIQWRTRPEGTRG
jgi:hypothetical protein